MPRCLIACGLFVTGCQDGAPQPGGSSLEQGLTVFSETRKDGLVGMFAEGERAVFFETVTQPMTEEVIAHHDADGVELTRPTFSLRWTDEEGRAVVQDGEWDDGEDFADPDRWEVTLDLTRKAGVALAHASLAPEVVEEQADLARTASEIPEAAARTVMPTPEDLEQIRDREIQYGYLGYSWKSYYYVRKPNGAIDFHQGSSWDNWRRVSGVWKYYNQKVQNNGVSSPAYECSGVWSNVQDYKSFAATGSAIHLSNNGRCSGQYAECTLPFTQSFNCRSEALRQQVWVVGNVACSHSSGMCDTAQGIGWGGAYCGMRTSCSSRAGC
ncbi:MAG TPA: hypothetical protein VIV11_03435 [Kofleriaceae bacterium]